MNSNDQAPYPGYGTFVIDQRNGQPQDPGAQWRITAGGDHAALEDPAYPRYRTRHASLQGAVDEIRQRLADEHKALLERAEGCMRQMAELETLYLPQPSPGQAIAAQRDKLVAALRLFAVGREVGTVRFAGFTIQLPYLHSSDVLVVSLPEYEAVNPRFLSSDIKLLRQILAEAGFTDCESWNGIDCLNVGFRLKLPAKLQADTVDSDQA